MSDPGPDMTGSEEVEIPNGSEEQPILVDEDQDIPQSAIGRKVEEIVRQVQRGNARFNPIDLDGEDENLSEDPWRVDEDNYDNDNAKIEREELATEVEDTQDGPCVHWKKGIRNPCPCGTHHKVPNATVDGIELNKSQLVELKESIRVGRYEAEFVEIHEIWTPLKSEQPFIRGRAYSRTRNLEGRIEPRKNEVCELYEIDTNDYRTANPITYLEQALVEIPFDNIKTIRTLHKTNKAFPECRFDSVRYKTKQEREDEAPLACRWQMVLTYPDPRYRRQQRPIDGEEIRHYSYSDIPKDRHRVPDSERRKAQGKIRGGSFIPNGALEPDPESSEVHLAPGQKYTVVDVFSGAGGYSTGAKMAGLKILAACDHWPRCCETYRENFPDAELHQEDVYKYIEKLNTDLTRDHSNVDILHFSPPCQTWSPAHTCEGKKDEENRATLFACEKIITIFHPRIFTVEQTFGLAQERWIPNFNALIQGFTRHGYSVKWKVIHLVEFGLPQTRKRLVMIGAAPGEQLPAWPKPTHSKDPKDGQKPLVSAFKACSGLVEGENLHDVEGARPADKIPWDGSKPLERTITTSGGQCYFWSGERELTLAEFAALQGFPPFFRFVGKCIKKQIGNAFPPVVVKTLLKSIRVHLEKFDGVSRQPAPGQIIIVSDDDDNHDKGNKSQPQIKNQSQLTTQDLAGFYKKPSGMSQELLQGIIEDVRETPVQCFLAKANRTSSKGNGSAGPSLRRSSRRRTNQAQDTQRNALDSYFSPANQDPPATEGNVVGSGPNEPVLNNPDSALVAADDDNPTAQDIVDRVSNAPVQSTANSDETTAGQPIVAGRNIGIGQTITAGVISARSRQDSNADESTAHRSARTAQTIANIDAPTCKKFSHSEATMSPPQTRFASLRSASHRSARTAQTIAGMNSPSAQGRSSPGDATASQPRRTGRIIDGVLTAPRRQSPPGFNDVVQPQVPLAVQSRPASNAAMPSQPHNVAQAIEGIIEAASRSTIFPGLAEELRSIQIGEDATIPSVPDLQNSPGSSRASPGQTTSPGRIVAGVLTAPRRRSPPGFNNAPPRRDLTEEQAIAGVIEAARRSTIFPGLAEQLQAGQGRQRSSGDSVAYAGESPRPGASRSLPIVVEDDEEEQEDKDEGGDDEEVEDHDEEDQDQLQWVTRISMVGAPSRQDYQMEVDEGFDPTETALALERSIQDARRVDEDYEAEDLYGATPEREMRGLDDDRGKGKEAARRSFDEFDEDGEAQREGGTSKRRRSRK
ncbi:hypothetical protein J7T55_011860 [Diaporthe amygdali]|uniref:uncharacterized protein n=1 Tax=Phomopsis amygdali TaxID=1214568 RepID=UPI0022FED90D|nr:uncharacterized protein J7T55_011860 [Diaporthe amygdali]KAJ0123395.1 hypothetical protein J7T55_011860 [Diaporthe amygdali]